MRGLNDLVPKIARHATIETRLRMACVCLKWYTLINANPFVWQDQLDVYRAHHAEDVVEKEALREIKKLPGVVRCLIAYRNATTYDEPHVLYCSNHFFPQTRVFLFPYHPHKIT